MAHTWAALLPLLLAAAFACEVPAGLCVPPTKRRQALWPLPRQLRSGGDTVRLPAGPVVWGSVAAAECPVLQAAVAAYFVPCPPAAAVAATASPLVLRACTGCLPEGNSTEAYALTVGADGVTVRAKSAVGVVRALATLFQLATATADGAVVAGAPWSIVDEPAYEHRGVMLDPASNFLTLPLLRRTVLAMSMVKLNVLHLHLTDSQSFPFESATHPNLSRYGAYSPAEVYTVANMTDLVAYGASLGVTIQPEIDSPSHAYSWGLGAPGAVDCSGPEWQRSSVCADPPCGLLRVYDPDVLKLALDVFHDAMRVFGSSALIHAGADEVFSPCWGDATAARFEAYLTALGQAISAGGRRMVVWEDAVQRLNVTLPADTVVQVWLNGSARTDFLSKGLKVIDSTHDAWYLDCGSGDYLTGGADWCNPFKTWQDIYKYRPTHGVDRQYWAQLLGGEVCLWGEQVDDQNMEPKLWPRAASLAERLWSDPDHFDPVSVLHRLRYVSADLLAQGVRVSPMQPKFCSNSDYCDIFVDDGASAHRAVGK